MTKKTLKLLAVLLVICLVVAMAVFADSQSCVLRSTQYYSKSTWAYGNYARAHVYTDASSACPVMVKLFYDGPNGVDWDCSATASKGQHAQTTLDSGHTAWYCYLQPTQTSSGLGGSASGRVDTTLTAR